MRLTKAQSIVIAVGSIVLFFGIALALVQNKNTLPVRNTGSSEANPIATSAPTPQPSDSGTAGTASEVVLNQFHRSEVKDGKKLWEVQAMQGRYIPESASIVLEHAKLFVYQKSGETITLDAERAHLFLSGQELERAETSGGVKVNRDGKITLETDAATYLRKENIVKAPGFVQIKSDTIDVSGTGLDVNLDSEEITLHRDVSSIVQPQKSIHQSETNE